MLKPQSEERSTITLFSIGQCWDEVGTLTLDRSQVPLTPDKEDKVRQPMFADRFDPSRKYYYSRPLSLSIARSREVVNGPRPHLCDCVRCLRLSNPPPLLTIFMPAAEASTTAWPAWAGGSPSALLVRLRAS